MTTLLEAKAREFMAAYPRPSMHPWGNPWGADNWHGKCALFVGRFGYYLGWAAEPTPPYDTAVIVALRSGPLNGDSTTAPVGAIHFWGWADQRNDGDVTIEVAGGGRSMAMGYRAPDEMVGDSIGFGNLQNHMARMGTNYPYMGWAAPGRYADGQMIIPADPPPVTPSQRQVGAEAANRRPDATTGQAPLELLAPGTIFAPIGWETGETVAGNPVWFGHPAGGFVWSGGCTDTGTHDLIDITPPPAPVPVPVPTPVPPAPTPLPDPVPPAPDPAPTPAPVPPAPVPKPRLGWGSALVLTIIGVITALLALIRI